MRRESRYRRAWFRVLEHCCSTEQSLFHSNFQYKSTHSHKNTPSPQPHQLREFLGKISFCHVAQQGLYQTSPTSIETTHQNLISFPKNISTLWILIVCWLTTATIISGLSFFFFFFFATNRPTQRFNSDHKYKVTQRPSSFFFPLNRWLLD